MKQTPFLIDANEAVREIIAMQSKTTTKNTDAWYALNRAIHILWRLQDAPKS